MSKLTLTVWMLLMSTCLLVMQLFYLIHWDEMEFYYQWPEMGI